MNIKTNMKYKLLIFFILIVSIKGFTQTVLPPLHDSLFGTYYYQKVTTFRVLPKKVGEIVFIGNSITDSGEWSDIFNDIHVSNMGISGDISAGIINRLPDIIERKPKKIFLMIGTNDLARNISPDSLIKNINMISKYIKEKAPDAKLYIQSILPVSDHYKKFSGHTKNNAIIVRVNQILSENATKLGYTYVDLHSKFIDKEGKLRNDLSNDGLHLVGEGYQLWKHLLYHLVYDLEEKPSLIPLPQKTIWNGNIFPLYKCTNILINQPEISHEAKLLQNFLTDNGIITSIKTNNEQYKITNSIELILTGEQLTENQEEGYYLSVSEKNILIKANSSHGIFNGIQTLIQLARTGSSVDGCTIEDWPAFAWRGYMIDVGRNFVSVQSLKDQIDILAKYKMNVFHFHATEDIAWRIQIARYPQLTYPEHMLRNKGMYYSIGEIKELIQYCKERYITLIPEIDMPGHSAAFTRAMKFDMQSDSGLLVVKDILSEFCDTYDIPYIHIGSDEVKITNKNFIPEVTQLIESKGKKVIGWQPGGNIGDNTIRQMWQENKDFIKANKKLKLIDSRHLYLNHMDPLEAVPTIFYRKINNVDKGDSLNLGGILCLWHDRAVSKEEDLLTMNPVYPGILTFAEKTWQGGGESRWLAKIEENKIDQYQRLIHFEKRLLNHKSQYFKEKPFPYVAQTHQKWQLFGPYENKGDLSKKFDPELTPGFFEKTPTSIKAVGGTIILRHFWAPAIDAVLPNPKDSTTWYATTQVWSEEESVSKFWVGFNNLGRAQGSDSPPKNEWDHKFSKIWCNNTEVLPPNWLRAGQKGNQEIPLMDEGYEYRVPTLIPLKKGWNTIVIKAPVGTTKSVSWHLPVKWMFTFVQVPND